VNGNGALFDDLVAAGDPERARLLATHDLLVSAGAPPELPPSLASAPTEPKSTVIALPRRRYTAIAAVAIAATLLFGVGYAIGDRHGPASPVKTIAMAGPAGATGSIALLAADEAGNWPMRFEVSGLPPLPRGETYTLWLTKDGRLAESCGSFVVGTGTTEVPLNAPYRLRQFDDWVVVRTGTAAPILMRTATA
jgi:hypothetical protein